ncbi:16093_t:CDS:2, partial [Racocetra fulgida]
AYVVRVADKDGWSVAAKMTSGDMSDPMSELFISYGRGYYSNNQPQPVQVQVPSLYMPSGIQPQPFVYPNWQQISSQRMFCPPPTNNYWDETHSRDLSGSSLGQQPFHNSWSPNPWGKGHYANECGSRKHMSSSFRDESSGPKRS